MNADEWRMSYSDRIGRWVHLLKLIGRAFKYELRTHDCIWGNDFSWTSSSTSSILISKEKSLKNVHGCTTWSSSLLHMYMQYSRPSWTLYSKCLRIHLWISISSGVEHPHCPLRTLFVWYCVSLRLLYWPLGLYVPLDAFNLGTHLLLYDVFSVVIGVMTIEVYITWLMETCKFCNTWFFTCIYIISMLC